MLRSADAFFFLFGGRDLPKFSVLIQSEVSHFELGGLEVRRLGLNTAGLMLYNSSSPGRPVSHLFKHLENVLQGLARHCNFPLVGKFFHLPYTAIIRLRHNM